MQFLLLERITVQNANAISGLTYGFPGITNFLGFAHALSRKAPSQLGVSFAGVAVVCHKHQVHAKRPSQWADYTFALTRNPLTKDAKTAPINEEGRMDMQVSLLIEIEGLAQGDRDTNEALVDWAMQHVPFMRLAGGQITGLASAQVVAPSMQKKALHKLMPAFALIDRSDYLAEHFEALKAENANTTLMDAWLDFAKLQYKAEPLEEGETKAKWLHQPKPAPGYLVPIVVGYKAISPLYEPGNVAGARDAQTPVTFVEAVHSIGQWQSVHRFNNIDEMAWRYSYESPWYIAKTSQVVQAEQAIEPDEDEEEISV
ncbi:type I-F CRISPR-associated protein Csy2 [Salinibius halmophilus]|uniref:type I-F CRISPR-associated protein Csy2 n=1 Tax=Salinibius halmophilus TaxID=1853216 RepID=UPI000E66841E|nr:type I-F CRISPR-associated protein Csy2 [Salinibius halmophilus]